MSINTNTKCLITVQGQIPFISAYIAFRWCQEKIWLNKSEVTLLIYDTCVPEENEISFKNSIKEIAGIERFHKIIYVSQLESNDISKRRYKKSIGKFKKLVGVDSFDYIFLCNDFNSFLTKLIPNAYPDSLKVEYGDFFGIIGNNDAAKVKCSDLLVHPIDFLKVNLKKFIYGHYHIPFVFDLSVLIMPLIFDADCLKNRNLIIPDQVFVKDIFFSFSALLTKLNDYCDELLVNSSDESKLYLLSNFANSGLCTPEKEISLYEEIILQTAVPGDRIILKNHPRGSNIVLIKLEEKLRPLFEIKVIADDRFKFIPIELWLNLLNRCKIFPIYSSSGISLKYLYSKQVNITFDSEKVRKYILFNKRQSISVGNDMINGAIEKLAHWEGKTPLWEQA